MAIRFGGNASGYTINSPTFDTKTFDCGVDYRLFINRIDKVCKQHAQRVDAVCSLKQNLIDLMAYTGGDCVQRVNVVATEIPWTPIMQAACPCCDINDLVMTDALVVASDGTCAPGIKAFEINITFSGMGDGTAFLENPAGAAQQIGNFQGIDAQTLSIINSIPN
jgi:hypothetical protein